MLDRILQLRGEYAAIINHEYSFKDAICDSVENGYPFDVQKAEALVEHLDQELDTLKEAIEPHFPKKPIPKSRLHTPPKVQFKKDGTLSAVLEKYLQSYGIPVPELIDGEAEIEYKGKKYSLPLTEPFETEEATTIQDTAFMKEYLMTQGWRPTIWNYKKDPENGKFMKDEDGELIPLTPKIRDTYGNICPSLLDMEGDLAKNIVKAATLKHRRSCVLSRKGNKGWLAHPKVQAEGVIPADMDTIGTNTSRVRHIGVCNIPQADEKKLYGKELRELFCVKEKDYYQVGYDASALESRMEAHYTFPYDNGVYAKMILETDIHQFTADVLGIKRSEAKTVRYALMYGASIKRLAMILGISIEQAKNIYEGFWDQQWALKSHINALEKEWEGYGQKYIKGLDKRPLWIRSKHALANTNFQSSGAIIMKRAHYTLWEQLREYREEGLVQKLVHYHDEEQFKVHKSLVKFQKIQDEEEGLKLKAEGWSQPFEKKGCLWVAYSPIGHWGTQSIKDAGKYFNLNVELDADYMIGKNWADCH